MITFTRLPEIAEVYGTINPFSTTSRYKRHQNKVKVKGLGRNSSYLAGFLILFFSCSLKQFNQLAKKNTVLKFFFSSIKS